MLEAERLASNQASGAQITTLKAANSEHGYVSPQRLKEMSDKYTSASAQLADLQASNQASAVRIETLEAENSEIADLQASNRASAAQIAKLEAANSEYEMDSEAHTAPRAAR